MYIQANCISADGANAKRCRRLLLCNCCKSPLGISQKLGFPTKITSAFQAYHNDPIEDMAYNASFQIFPAVNKRDYGMHPHLLTHIRTRTRTNVLACGCFGGLAYSACGS